MGLRNWFPPALFDNWRNLPTAAGSAGEMARELWPRGPKQYYDHAMTLSSQLIPAWLSFPLLGLMLLTCTACLWSANWAALREAPVRAHLLFGGAIACLGLWLISFPVIEGIRVHFLGVTALTLILGWRFAILAGSAAVLAQTLALGQPLVTVSTAWLLTVATPATVSRWLVYQLRGLKSQNLFIYMLGAGFGGGVLSALVVSVLAVCLLGLGGQEALVKQALENWPVVLLLLFPEGFINGMIVSTFTVFYPELVKTLDDEHYFGQ